MPATPGSKGEPQRIFRLKASQTRDNVRMRALFNCKDTKTPVVLLAGTQWPFFPRLKDLGKANDDDSSVRYAVLGHYLVTHIWAEGEPIDRADEPVASSSATPAGPDFFVRFKVRAFCTRWTRIDTDGACLRFASSGSRGRASRGSTR